MNLIDRAKNILLSPKTEWEVINTEEATPMSLLTSYVIPMALIGAVASFIGYGFVGLNILGVKIGGMQWGIAQGVMAFVGTIASYFISSYVIDALAPSFASEKNINKSAQLVAYASTAAWVAAIFNIMPALGILAIVGLYSIYLFYLGLTPMKNTPEDKKIVYMIVSALVIIVCTMVVGFILSKVVYAVLGNPYEAGLNNLFKM
jgi:Yip1 domain